MPVIDPNRKPPKVWHVFSPKLARLAGQGAPDITVALILEELAFWQKNRYDHLLIDGKRHCFRSLAQLAKSHPYLSKSAIEKAINRAEARGLMQVLRDGKTLKYHVPENLEGIWETQGKLWFRIDEANKHGVPAALVVANLVWQRNHTVHFRYGADGARYYPLSPSELAKHLCISRDTISRALERLTSGSEPILTRIPSGTHHYAYTCSVILERRAKGGGLAAKGDTCAAKVDDFQKGVSNNYKSQEKCEPNPSSASPADDSVSFSPSESTSEVNLVAPEVQVSADTFQEEPSVSFSRYEHTGSENMTASSAVSQFTDWRKCSKASIATAKAKAADLATGFRKLGLPCTKTDERLMVQLFLDNTRLEGADLVAVLRFCVWLQNPRKEVGSTESIYVLYDDNTRFPKKVESAGYFLRRLPEILAQLRFGEAEDELLFQAVDFSYLGELRDNAVDGFPLKQQRAEVASVV